MYFWKLLDSLLFSVSGWILINAKKSQYYKNSAWCAPMFLFDILIELFICESDSQRHLEMLVLVCTNFLAGS